MDGLTRILTELFNQVSSLDFEDSPEVRYSQRDILEIAVDDLIIKDDTPEPFDDRVVNFQSIIQSGEVPQGFFSGENYHVDWQSDDLFNQRINEIEINVTERVSQHNTLQDLIDKPEWTTQDRVKWEFHLSEIVSEEVNEISGFGDYRNSSASPVGSLFGGIVRESRANEVSRDLEAGSQAIEFDCELMAIVEGSILQRVENTLLPEASEQDGGYKEVGNYFYAQSEVSFRPQNNDSDERGGHAYIISSVTGNIIEATADPDDNKHPYTFNVDPNFSFEKFVETGLAITNGGIYLAESIELEEARTIQSELIAFEQSKADILFEYIQGNYAGVDLENPNLGKYDTAMEMLVWRVNVETENYKFMVEGYETQLANLETRGHLEIKEYMGQNPADFAHLQTEEEINAFIEKEIEAALLPYRESYAEAIPDKEAFLREKFSESVRGLYESGDGIVVEGFLHQISLDNAEIDISKNSLVSMSNTYNEVEEQQVAQSAQSRLSLDMV